MFARERSIAWRRRRSTNKLSKVIDIGQTDAIWNILWVRCHFANRSHVLRTKAVSYALFVEVGVGREGQNRGL
jgi:hypothetical protein